MVQPHLVVKRNLAMNKKNIKLSLLVISMLLVHQSYALEALSEQNMREISGQDGLTVQLQTDKILADQMNWKDNTVFADGSTGNLNLSLNKMSITPLGNQAVGGTVKLDVGGAGSSNTAGIRLEAALNPSQIHFADIKVCSDNAGKANCSDSSSQSLGALTLQDRDGTKFLLQTSNGLFNAKDLAYLEFGLQNANIFYSLKNSSAVNQLVLKDFNFNFKGSGYMYLDPVKGFVLSTNAQNTTGSNNQILLERVADLDNAGKTKPGFNIDLRYKPNAGSDPKAYSAQNSDTTLKPIIRLGASGVLKDAEISVNADKPTLGGAQIGSTTASGDMTGSTGLHLAMKTSFTPDIKDSNGQVTSQGTRLELGGTGTNAYAIEFGNLTPLQIRQGITSGTANLALNQNLASINFGDLYINTIKSQSMEFQISSSIAALLGQQAGIYRHNLYESGVTSNPNILSLAIRGMEFQAIARSARFIADNSNDANHQISNQSGTWGLGLPIYNLNANLGVYGTTYGTNKDKQGIGFGLAMSTQGRNSDGSKTTSIMLIDGAKNSTSGEEVNYYAGLRNIDLFLDTNGTIGFEQNGIAIDLTKLIIALNAELALGQLPGSRYNTAACATSSSISCFVPSNSFTQNSDVLFAIAMRLDGTASLMLIPGSASDLNLTGNVKLNASGNNGNKNYIHIVDPGSNAAMGLDQISGNLNVDANLKLTQDTFKIANTLQINPNQDPSGVLKANLNFYPTATSSGQQLGQMVITGGNIRSSIGITPR